MAFWAKTLNWSWSHPSLDPIKEEQFENSMIDKVSKIEELYAVTMSRFSLITAQVNAAFLELYYEKLNQDCF